MLITYGSKVLFKYPFGVHPVFPSTLRIEYVIKVEFKKEKASTQYFKREFKSCL